jgi:hypothetical protein
MCLAFTLVYGLGLIGRYVTPDCGRVADHSACSTYNCCCYKDSSVSIFKKLLPQSLARGDRQLRTYPETEALNVTRKLQPITGL